MFRISRLDESGIYEHKVRKSLNPKGFGPEFDSKIDVNEYEFKALDLNKLRGVFILLSFYCVCIISFTLELFALFIGNLFFIFFLDLKLNYHIIYA